MGTFNLQQQTPECSSAERRRPWRFSVGCWWLDVLRCRKVAPLLIAAATLPVLYFFPPQHASFYPRFLLNRFAGWQCPGCGGLRATHELLHGRVVEAWDLNAFWVSLVPVAALYAGASVWKEWMGRNPLPFLWRPLIVWIIAGLAIVFGILRNVSFSS